MERPMHHAETTRKPADFLSSKVFGFLPVNWTFLWNPYTAMVTKAHETSLIFLTKIKSNEKHSKTMKNIWYVKNKKIGESWQPRRAFHCSSRDAIPVSKPKLTRETPLLRCAAPCCAPACLFCTRYASFKFQRETLKTSTFNSMFQPSPFNFVGGPRAAGPVLFQKNNTLAP